MNCATMQCNMHGTKTLGFKKIKIPTKLNYKKKSIKSLQTL